MGSVRPHSASSLGSASCDGSELRLVARNWLIGGMAFNFSARTKPQHTVAPVHKDESLAHHRGQSRGRRALLCTLTVLVFKLQSVLTEVSRGLDWGA